MYHTWTSEIINQVGLPVQTQGFGVNKSSESHPISMLGCGILSSNHTLVREIGHYVPPRHRSEKWLWKLTQRESSKYWSTG